MALIIWQPLSPIQVKKTNKDVKVKMNVPNFDPKKIKIKVKNQMLMVSGEMQEKEREKKKNYFREEIRQRAFSQAVSLPVKVDAKKIKSTYKKGVLEIVLPQAKVLKAPARKALKSGKKRKK